MKLLAFLLVAAALLASPVAARGGGGQAASVASDKGTCASSFTPAPKALQAEFDKLFTQLNKVGEERAAAKKPALFPTETKLKIYGLQQQAKNGDATGKKPGGLKEGKKWDAWNAQRGKSPADAMTEYISIAKPALAKVAAEEAAEAAKAK